MKDCVVQPVIIERTIQRRPSVKCSLSLEQRRSAYPKSSANSKGQARELAHHAAATFVLFPLASSRPTGERPSTAENPQR
jgi:hypothetical protein